MGGTMVVKLNLWVWALMTVVAVVPAAVVAHEFGVNWGTIASHPLDPKIVVNLMKDNGIKKVKLFDADLNIYEALAGSDIEVMVGIPNYFLENLATKYSTVQAWVKENVTAVVGKGGVNITYVAVGNEPFLQSYNGSFTNNTLPAMKNIRKALNEAGFGKDKIKVSTPLNGDVYWTLTYHPQDGVWRSDIADLMVQLCKFLDENDAAFIINIYPFFNLYQNPGFPYGYAFFDSNSTFDASGLIYHNVFDANIDTLVAALNKSGTPDLPIIVGEVGWPTDGDFRATPANAHRFYTGLAKKMAGNQGTPLRPKSNPVVYMFCLLDEDFKSVAPGMFERHWGVFGFDGQPKFAVDLNAKGLNTSLVGAKDVPYLAKQWCVYNPDAKNQEDLEVKVEWACNNTDCTSLVQGASCSDMGRETNASVAFNMYYQMQDQAKAACDFQGLAKIVKQDPSNATCHFPVMIAKYKAQHPGYPANSTLAPSGSASGSGSGSGSDSNKHSSSSSPLFFFQFVVVAICTFLFA